MNEKVVWISGATDGSVCYGTNVEAFLKAVARNSKSKYYKEVCPWPWVTKSYFYFSSYYRDIAQDNLNGMLTDAITFASQFLLTWITAATRRPGLEAEKAENLGLAGKSS